MKHSFLTAGALGLSILAACAAPSDDGEPTPDTSADELTTVTCADVANTDQARSLAVTDPTILAKFSFMRVMDQIRTTANVVSTTTDKGLYQAWMKTFGSSSAAGDCNDPGLDPNKFGFMCPRLPEVKLAGVDPFAAAASTTFQPVALFNRFDLAPSNGANCGEYRIVYAMRSTALSGRALVIFEAALANPNPAAGIEACLPIARFWQGLSADTSVASRATKLENFYFNGTAIKGVSVAPVVRAAHYGLSTNAGAPTSGQVRTNFFIDNAQWHLREFKLKRTCTDAANAATCHLAFGHVTVKTNPANELFTGKDTSNAPAYRTEFASRMGTLLTSDVTTIGLTVTNRFNELESASQLSNDVVYSAFADSAMRSAIQTKLTAIQSPLTVKNVLDRATTQTCAGCHQRSNGVALGGGKVWPRSGGFVQVDEAGNLSEALTKSFLPHRKVVLEKFINDRCTPAGAPAPAVSRAAPNEADVEMTIGGSPVGAAN